MEKWIVDEDAVNIHGADEETRMWTFYVDEKYLVVSWWMKVDETSWWM